MTGMPAGMFTQGKFAGTALETHTLAAYIDAQRTLTGAAAKPAPETHNEETDAGDGEPSGKGKKGKSTNQALAAKLKNLEKDNAAMRTKLDAAVKAGKIPP